MFYKNGALKIFAKLTGKHMCFSPFFNKVAGVKPGNFIKRDTGVFL